MKDKLVYLITHQGQYIKILFEVLKEVLNDISIKFIDKKSKPANEMDKKMKMCIFNDSKTMVVVVELDGKNFDKFELEQNNYEIGLNLHLFHNFIKCIEKDSILTLYVDKNNEQSIKIDLDNGKKNSLSYSQKVIDVESMDNKFSVSKKIIDSTFSVIMETSEFKTICSIIHNIEDVLKIKCTENYIDFYCGNKGSNSKIIKTFKNNDELVKGGVRIIKTAKDDEEKKGFQIFKGKYDLKDISIFSKCTNLCPNLTLNLGLGKPLFINYTVGNLGKMVVCFMEKIK